MATQSKKTHRATTKKAPAKKKAPTTAGKETKTDSKLLAVAREVLPAIRLGEITVRSVWRDQLKLGSIVPLRNAFIEILGSKAAWNKVLADRHTKARAEKKGVRAV